MRKGIEQLWPINQLSPIIKLFETHYSTTGQKRNSPTISAAIIIKYQDSKIAQQLQSKTKPEFHNVNNYSRQNLNRKLLLIVLKVKIDLLNSLSLKAFVYRLDNSPSVICSAETWLYIGVKLNYLVA